MICDRAEDGKEMEGECCKGEKEYYLFFSIIFKEQELNF